MLISAVIAISDEFSLLKIELKLNSETISFMLQFMLLYALLRSKVLN